jgi:hypothetical protein
MHGMQVVRRAKITGIKHLMLRTHVAFDNLIFLSHLEGFTFELALIGNLSKALHNYGGLNLCTADGARQVIFIGRPVKCRALATVFFFSCLSSFCLDRNSHFVEALNIRSLRDGQVFGR